MLHAFRSPRLPHPSLLSYSRPLIPNIRFAQAQSGPTDADGMESKKESRPQSETMDTMSSLGEGYATRSDEEGFGGVYGGKQHLSKDADDAAAEADHKQGCEVKEKEKARNQENIPRQD